MSGPDRLAKLLVDLERLFVQGYGLLAMDPAVAQAQFFIAATSFDEEIRPRENSADHEDGRVAAWMGYRLGWWALGIYPARNLSEELQRPWKELGWSLAMNAQEENLVELVAQIVGTSGRADAMALFHHLVRESAVGQRLGPERVMPTLSVIHTGGVLLALIEAALLGLTGTSRADV
jgi:hypothetical protein